MLCLNWHPKFIMDKPDTLRSEPKRSVSITITLQETISAIDFHNN